MIPKSQSEASTVRVQTLSWISLVVQWIGVGLLMERTQLRFLVWEDFTSHETAGPVCQTTAPALEPASCGSWSACSATREAATVSSLCTAGKSSPALCNQREPCAQRLRPRKTDKQKVAKREALKKCCLSLRACLPVQRPTLKYVKFTFLICVILQNTYTHHIACIFIGLF